MKVNMQRYNIIKTIGGETEELFTGLLLKEAERISTGLKAQYRDNEEVIIRIIESN